MKNKIKIAVFTSFLYCILILLLGNLNNTVYAEDNIAADTITQISTINSLLGGNYDGLYKIGDVKKYGDFGLGTVHSLDGELIILNGEFFQIKIDGKIYKVSDEMTSPYLDITTFNSDESFDISDEDFEKLSEKIKKKINPNFFYAIKLEGDFEYVKTRSVTAQKPYKPLLEIIKGQKVFELKNVKGTVVGLFSPDFVDGIIPKGFHFHFITSDKLSGGHILTCKIKNAKVHLDLTQNFSLLLPNNFEQGNINPSDIEKAEKPKSH